MEGEFQCDTKETFSSQELECIQSWIQTQIGNNRLPHQYENAKLSGFKAKQFGTRKNIAFVRIDSGYCQNIGRAHSTNTVYLEVDGEKKGAFMKCFCRCDTTDGRLTRINGKIVQCKDYKSDFIDAQSLSIELFGSCVLSQKNKLCLIENDDEVKISSLMPLI